MKDQDLVKKVKELIEADDPNVTVVEVDAVEVDGASNGEALDSSRAKETVVGTPNIAPVREPPG
jgi:hypothetical protein